ncbi:universal stress protein family protein [Caballeronia calidae]|uniref:Universal stress protein family protein n=1 Tax=Caballeronia calidae TaxID=1777139 RepID=A0A158CXN9_9BURK|nr:universal stress protein [Caballeronia calidae]SAK87094.1 universal stress protein family protein [Caballeronia calidae]
MSYKSIVVHLDASERAVYRLEIALLLAKRFKAHLDAVYAVFTPEPRAFGVMGGAAAWYETHQDQRQERSRSLERLFHAGVARAGLSGDWIEAPARAREKVARRGRCADLIIAGQDDPNDPETYIADHFAESLVMTAGRPLLLLPYSGVFPNVGSHVLVAWDGSREATRAMHDALPFLKEARQVTLVTIGVMKGEQPGGRIPGADIASTLARHDVRVTVRETDKASDSSVGDALLSEARSVGANLIVMGGYGHARWQEVVLGGATRTMLHAMTMPVLMSH